LGFSADGGFAEYLPVPESMIAAGGVNLIPDNVANEEAVFTEPLASCLNAQEKARVGEGDTILIVGGGPLGLLHSWMGRRYGARKIIIAEKSGNRLNLARALGRADRVVDVNNENLSEAVADETGGHGADVVLLATNAVLVSELLPLLADGGRLSLFSGLKKELSSLSFDVNQIHYRELEVSGAYGSTAVQNATALQLIAEGLPVNELVTLRLGLDEVVEGINYTSACRGLRVLICFDR
jgi:L-iditol 2-dehydrogenase